MAENQQAVPSHSVEFQACVDELGRIKAQHDRLRGETWRVVNTACGLLLNESGDETLDKVKRHRRMLDGFKRLDDFYPCAEALHLAQYWLEEAIKEKGGAA